jgi:flagellar hook-associated protein 3 FlgL
MRVNPNPIADILASIALDQQTQETALAQLASGRRVNLPSDDPAAAATLSLNHAQASQDDQFLQVISGVSARLQVADSTIGSVVSSLDRAISLGIEGGGGATLSNANRSAIVTELQGLQQQILGLANTSFQGSYIFAGTASTTAPFSANPASPSGVSYAGNAGTNTLAVGQSFSVTVNLPGSQLFSGTGGDVFQSLQDLIVAVQNNTGIDTAVLGLRKAFDVVTTQRVFYGNVLQQLDAQQTSINSEKLQLARQENAVGGADPAAAASAAVSAATARTAALQAATSLLNTSLFNFLK